VWLYIRRGVASRAGGVAAYKLISFAGYNSFLFYKKQSFCREMIIFLPKSVGEFKKG
jgi:hypothetical protein